MNNILTTEFHGVSRGSLSIDFSSVMLCLVSTGLGGGS